MARMLMRGNEGWWTPWCGCQHCDKGRKLRKRAKRQQRSIEGRQWRADQEDY